MPNYQGLSSNEDIDKIAGLQSTASQIDTTVSALSGTITAGTNTKITYDANGLVTASANATTEDITETTSKVFVTPVEKLSIGANSLKVGITVNQASDIISNNQKVGITTTQRDNIIANNDKTGITTTQASDIVANNAKVVITTTQANHIIQNTSKTGFTNSLVDNNSNVYANTQKVGYTEALVSANSSVVANTAKVTYTEAKVSANASVAANTAKISFVLPTYSVNTFYADLGGYVIQIGSNGKHGIVVAMQDQSTSNDWFTMNDLLSDPTKHDANGKKFLDWRVPTKRELNILYIHYNTGGNAAGLTANHYWSSTNANSSQAWVHDFASLGAYINNKAATVDIRAVRSF